MKTSSRILSLLIIVMVATVYMGCKKDNDNEKTEEEIQLNKLRGAWTLETANDDVDRTSEFPGLVLTLSGNYAAGGTYNYSFAGTRPDPSPWPENGTWKFGTNKLTEMVRDPTTQDELEMTYSVNETNLIITFTVPEGHQGWPGGRTSAVTGEWIFTFKR